MGAEKALVLRHGHVVHRVDVRAVVIDREVQVRTCGPAGRTDVADGLTLRHIVAGGDDVVGHMTVKARITVGVVDGHHVAVSFIVAGGSDGAGLCGIDCRAGTGRQVHALCHLYVPLSGWMR